MKRLLLVLLAAGVAAAPAAQTARADPDAWVALPSSSALLPTFTPNGPGLLVPPDFSSRPVSPEQLTPAELLPIWQAAGDAYGVPWQVLAAINKVESDFGRNMGPSEAGAVGWMQFMPATWLEYGTDADGDGVADPWNAKDAIYSAARYLAASGAQADLRSAVFAYNHADWYVDEVLQLASAFETGGGQFPSRLDKLSASLDQAQQDVMDAKAALDDGLARVQGLVAAKRGLELDAGQGELLGDRLEATQEAAQADVELADARAEVDDLRTTLAEAEQALAEAQQSVAGASFAPGTGYLLAAPVAKGSWVFPVGGGPELVSVAPGEPDSSSTEIAAPAGTPVYALADGNVVEASPDPSGHCGIGATLQTADGREWRYCHLAYLDAAVTAGGSLSAGSNIGLVGQTGSAGVPGLGLELQSGSAAPQSESWFGALAGRAFRWQGTVSEPSGTVFAVVS